MPPAVDETSKWLLAQGALGFVALVALAFAAVLWRSREQTLKDCATIREEGAKAVNDLQERRVSDAKVYGEKMSALAESYRSTVDKLTEALKAK